MKYFSLAFMMLLIAVLLVMIASAVNIENDIKSGDYGAAVASGVCYSSNRC